MLEGAARCVDVCLRRVKVGQFFGNVEKWYKDKPVSFLKTGKYSDENNLFECIQPFFSLLAQLINAHRANAGD